LADENILSDEFLGQLINVGEVDILIGVPTYNNASTAGQVAQSLEQALVESFARERVVIVNADGGSRDGTPEMMIADPGPHDHNAHGFAHLRTVHRLTTRYRGQPAFVSALRTILAAADLLRAKSCVILSPTSNQMTPGWIENLIRPTYKDDFHYVAPLYKRHKFDGLLIREALYPFGRAAYGQRIRELHAEEFGFSGTFACHCLNQEAWHQEAVRLGPATWMAIEAMSSGFKTCQAYLGAKSRTEAGATGDAVSAIRRTVGTLFWCLDANPAAWTERTGSEIVPTFGSAGEVTDEPIRVNRKRLFELFQSGVSELSQIVSQILQPETLAAVQAAAALDAGKMQFDDELWARVLYDFAASYHQSAMNRDHLLQALTPLYRGRVCAFLQKHQNSPAERIEESTETLCSEFERWKPYLLERWKAGS
jgi:glucosylglycerate synthase